jgi:hypothetical protein
MLLPLLRRTWGQAKRIPLRPPQLELTWRGPPLPPPLRYLCGQPLTHSGSIASCPRQKQICVEDRRWWLDSVTCGLAPCQTRKLPVDGPFEPPLTSSCSSLAHSAGKTLSSEQVSHFTCGAQTSRRFCAPCATGAVWRQAAGAMAAKMDKSPEAACAQLPCAPLARALASSLADPVQVLARTLTRRPSSACNAEVSVSLLADDFWHERIMLWKFLIGDWIAMSPDGDVYGEDVECNTRRGPSSMRLLGLDFSLPSDLIGGLLPASCMLCDSRFCIYIHTQKREKHMLKYTFFFFKTN